MSSAHVLPHPPNAYFTAWAKNIQEHFQNGRDLPLTLFYLCLPPPLLPRCWRLSPADQERTTSHFHQPEKGYNREKRTGERKKREHPASLWRKKYRAKLKLSHLLKLGDVDAVELCRIEDVGEVVRHALLPGEEKVPISILPEVLGLKAKKWKKMKITPLTHK